MNIDVYGLWVKKNKKKKIKLLTLISLIRKPQFFLAVDLANVVPSEQLQKITR